MFTDGILASQLSMGMPGAATGGVSQQSMERFQSAYQQATARVEGAATTTSPGATAPGAMSLLSPLLNLDSGSVRLANQAGAAALQKDMKPGELMMLTMRTHEFMFQCELTANVANRSSDGVQQLFRQQS